MSTTYSKGNFQRYNELVSVSCDDIPMQWRKLPGESGISHLLFNFENANVFARYHDKQMGNHVFVTEDEFWQLQDNIEWQFSGRILLFFLFFCPISYGFHLWSFILYVVFYFAFVFCVLLSFWWFLRLHKVCEVGWAGSSRSVGLASSGVWLDLTWLVSMLCRDCSMSQ